MNRQVGFLLATLGLFSASPAPAEQARPNILLIMADDQGYECLGANGSASYKTPRLDALAAQGARFEHCYAQPLCTPTRVQLMTGLYNKRNYIEFGLLDPKATTFAQVFQKAGYQTCVAGKWQLQGGFQGPNHFGFHEYCLWQLTRRPARYANPGLEINGKEVNYSQGEFGEDLVSDYLCAFFERNQDKPFLAYYPMMLTHGPFVPTPDSPDYDRKARTGVSEAGNRKHFASMVAYGDKTVGKLVDKLEALGLRKRTLILYLGDNGTGKGIVSRMGNKEVVGDKGATTNGGTHVSLIANLPGLVKAGQVRQDLVDTTDFFPTLVDFAGIKPAGLSLDGRSFLPQLKGEKGNPREWTYCWYSRNGGPTGVEFARNQRFKLYGDGKMFDLTKDELEKAPLNLAGLQGEAVGVKELLGKALEKYATARPKELKLKEEKKGKKKE
ncbi:MAG: arylsulfatase [Gemmataceae bacterium]|nr:arylsulfatase [Gemmataceae bacterium]